MLEKICCIGSRDWNDKAKIREVIETYMEKYPTLNTVISGGGPGADTLSIQVAKELGLNTITFNAQWQYYGRMAGPLRNRKMLDEGKPDVVIAFRKDINSRGTNGCMKEARERGIPTDLYTEGDR